MARNRSAKQLGTRYSLPSINRSVGFNPRRLALYVGPAVVALLILIGMAFSSSKKKHTAYSAGPLSSAHAFIGDHCEACHAPSGGFKREVKDNQCRTCHEGNDANDTVEKKVSNKVPDHQKNQVSSAVPACASCHIEHRGFIRPVQMPDAPCIQCHGQESLKTTGPSEHCKDHPWHRWPFRRVTGFGEPYQQAEHRAENPASTTNVQPCANPQPATVINDGPHPRFSAEPGEFHNPTTITFSHAAHLNLKETNNQPKLLCNDCHRPVADVRHTWPYSSPQIADAALGASPPRDPGQRSLSSKVAAVALNSGPGRDPGQTPYPDYGRPLMTMPKYEQSCAKSGCHDLTFANGIESLDHPKSKGELESSEGPIFPIQIRAKIADYLDKNKKLPSIAEDWPPKCAYDKNGRPACPKIVEKPEVSIPKDGLEQRVADAEKFVWKARCRLCHEPGRSSSEANEVGVPTWTKAAWTNSDMVQRFTPYAIFSHQAHSAISCEGCHVQPPKPDCCKPAPQSHDIHIPGIETCAKCHSGNPPAAGQAGNGCFLCHQYHPWDPSREMFRSQHTIEELTGWTPPQPKQEAGR